MTGEFAPAIHGKSSVLTTSENRTPRVMHWYQLVYEAVDRNPISYALVSAGVAFLD